MRGVLPHRTIPFLVHDDIIRISKRRGDFLNAWWSRLISSGIGSRRRIRDPVGPLRWDKFGSGLRERVPVNAPKLRDPRKHREEDAEGVELDFCAIFNLSGGGSRVLSARMEKFLRFFRGSNHPTERSVAARFNAPRYPARSGCHCSPREKDRRSVERKRESASSTENQLPALNYK